MQRIGRYEVVREIGRGGMGAVYEARDPELEREVAIKVLSGEHAGLFRDEARALAALNHAGIVTIHEIGEHDGRPYLVMEYLRGRSLRELLQARALGRDRLVAIGASVAAAIGEAHARGVLHRDIKPENVVVLDTGGVKVIDFGIARRLADSLELPPGSADDAGESRASRVVSAFARTLPVEITPGRAGASTVATLAGSTQTVFGTPAYMAPEVLAGEPSTPESDVYSLGVLLYECLAGRRPYEAPDLMSVVAMVLEGDEPPPPLHDPLAPLVARMLSRDPAQRPPLAEITAALAPARRRRSRARLIRRGALIAVVAGALAIAGWQLVMPARAPAARTTSDPIAIEPFAVSYTTYGDPPLGLSSVLAVVLAHIDGIRVVEPAQLALEHTAEAERSVTALRLGARYLLRGKIVEHDGQATGDLELVDLIGGGREHVTATQPVERSAALLVELANATAARVLPGAKLGPTVQLALARKLAELGTSELYAQHWASARPYLEQAAEADPSSPAIWMALAEARGWTLAPQPLVDDAVAHARTTTPPGARRTIVEGAGAYLRHDFDTAIATLGPLEHAPLSDDDRIDLAYYLGEAFWHRGDHARGAERLERAFEARRYFEPAGVHLMQFAIVHRDLPRAGVLIGQLGRSRQTYLFAAGDYEQVAGAGEFPLDAQAQLVLGRTPPPALEARMLLGNDGFAYRAARALAAGDPAAARGAIDDALHKATSQPATDRSLYELREVVAVTASSGLADQTRALLAWLQSSSSPRYVATYRRIACLAAPLAGTPLPVLDDTATPRQRALARAIAAELAGDHRTAADDLAELVADPSDSFDFGERIALVRNLRALHDPRLAAQCADVLRPPVFGYDYLLARKACRD